MEIYFLASNNIIRLLNICYCDPFRAEANSLCIDFINNIITLSTDFNVLFFLIHLFRLEILGGESLPSH